MTNIQAYKKLGTEELFLNKGKHYFFDSIDEKNSLLYISSVDENEFFSVHFNDDFCPKEKRESYGSRMKHFLNNVSFKCK